MAAASSVTLNQTLKFATLDVAGIKVNHKSKGTDHRAKSRLNAESGARVQQGVKLGGDFDKTKNPEFLKERVAIFDAIKARREEEMSSVRQEAIVVTLPDGKTVDGLAWKTSPMDIALGISKGLAQNCVVAKVVYSSRVPAPFEGQVCSDDGMEEEFEAVVTDGELWDMTRPLEGSCTLSLLKFSDDEGKMVFWHSSAHVLGEALEHTFGSFLTIGPPLANGFYYDSYMGDNTIHPPDFKDVDDAVKKIAKAKQTFERLVVTKEEALELFTYNPFKHQLISTKVPDGSRTTVYRNGDLIDLCRGPHIPSTGMIKAFSTLRGSSTNWLGDTENDSLQRLYAVAFPDKKMMATYLENLKKAEERDHRRIGTAQKLFFFHPLSPGSAFWLPHGARIYNTLIDFIKKQYWKRGYTEVITPNVYNSQLWETSGHWQHYAENMFQFEVEEATFALKPMNCPGHCLMFDSTLRSYRDLPMRYADFGVLHRNELSGALTGLTRVRRFQQDDGHIFCRRDQIRKEVAAALDFMKFVYDTFGMTYRLELSTRPKKALGDVALWNEAEADLAAAMNDFAGEGNWKVNPGDGAFYGPKIDIKVMDAMERVHQCATVQLDFQLPIRFDLKYKSGSSEGANEFERPIIVHRAMLGSVERMTAVLIEHYGGKWPFWLSPRQALVVPVTNELDDYANEVGKAIYDAGFFADVEDSDFTMQKKVRNGQLAQYNFILVVGKQERSDGTVNVRLRNNQVEGTMTVQELIARFTAYAQDYVPDF
uniref:Probable threonine--tRNA ligase, cytoplasmic n=1 Tax=Rhizochromulina marina TaxID=1034831 RepID=A0A7S2SGE3_9STRA|mmetsp:Transcript_29853/g.86936  ORF Transcript_29853/g.86936 Transcript_29853/m.86936 type:complete len:764 (+) Transcript_29853:170-2461(+)